MGPVLRVFFDLRPNKWRCSGWRLLVAGSVPVEIACLNSSALQQHKKLFQGHGFIGEDQLQDVERGLGWKEQTSGILFRIAMLHHHVVPVNNIQRAQKPAPSTALSWKSSAPCKIGSSNTGFVAFYGHMHHAFCTRIMRPITGDDSAWHEFFVLGMGSSGVEKEDLPPDSPHNTFGLLRFEPTGVLVEVHSIDPTLPSKRLFDVKIPDTAGS